MLQERHLFQVMALAIFICVSGCASDDGESVVEEADTVANYVAAYGECQSKADCYLTGEVSSSCMEFACVAAEEGEGNVCEEMAKAENSPCSSDSCSADAAACSQCGCNPTGECVAQAAFNGTACGDVNDCGGSYCTDGVCAAEEKNCDDENSCTSDSCEDGECIYAAAEGDCDDNDSCTTEDTCTEGMCAGTASDCACEETSDCPAPMDLCMGTYACLEGICVMDESDATLCDEGTPCEVGSCDPGTGACSYTVVANGETCDDGNTCTTNDTCVRGACMGEEGTTEICDDGMDNNCDEAVDCEDATCEGDPACETVEPAFCETWVETCGEWTADTSCGDWWTAAAAGTEGDTEGATQACYWYHLGVAQSMETEEDTALHCGHAMGEAPCVNPEPTFCETWVATCGEWTADTSCADWWTAAAAGTDGDTSGATQACYTYHLDVAQTMETEEDTALHCGHAMGEAPCVDPEPTFCETWVATCGEWTADTSCADWWTAAAAGTDGDTSGATQACYMYHLGVAQGMETEEDVALHCGHAMGDEPCVDEVAPVDGTVTFAVDMSCPTSSANPFTGETAYVVGLDQWNEGWKVAAELSDDDVNGIWEGSWTGAAGDYNFTLSFGGIADGNWSEWYGQENLEGQECIADEYGNRGVTVVAGATQVLTLTHSYCDGICPEPSGDVDGCMNESAANFNSLATVEDGSCTFNTTFYVNMACYMAPYEGVYLNGIYNGWCGDCNPMTQNEMDENVYQITVPLPLGVQEFKFAVKEVGVDDLVWENLDAADSCTTTGEFVNRTTTVEGGSSQGPFAIGSCDNCAP